MAVATINQTRAAVDKAVDAVSALPTVCASKKALETLNHTQAEVVEDNIMGRMVFRRGELRAVLAVEVLHVCSRCCRLDEARSEKRPAGVKVDVDTCCRRIRHGSGQPRSGG